MEGGSVGGLECALRAQKPCPRNDNMSHFMDTTCGTKKKLTFLPSCVNVRDPTSRNQLSPQSQQLCPRMRSKRQLFSFGPFGFFDLRSSRLEKGPYSFLRFKTRFRNLGECLVPQDPSPTRWKFTKYARDDFHRSYKAIDVPDTPAGAGDF